MGLTQWALRHGISPQALLELEHMFGTNVPHTVSAGESESAVQAKVRLAAASKGYYLFRNNVGVLLDKTGRPVRYGLANDSANLNKAIKSGDLIGWREVRIEPADVGHVIAQFVSLESKRSNWKYSANDEREVAQMAWARLVTRSGGIGKFIKDEVEL